MQSDLGLFEISGPSCATKIYRFTFWLGSENRLRCFWLFFLNFPLSFCSLVSSTHCRFPFVHRGEHNEHHNQYYPGEARGNIPIRVITPTGQTAHQEQN